jgi:hypothetical protein
MEMAQKGTILFNVEQNRVMHMGLDMQIVSIRSLLLLKSRCKTFLLLTRVILGYKRCAL